MDLRLELILIVLQKAVGSAAMNRCMVCFQRSMSLYAVTKNMMLAYSIAASKPLLWGIYELVFSILLIT